MNPDLVLGVMSALTGFILKTALAFGVCLGLELAGQFSRPEIYGLVRLSLWNGSVLALAGDGVVGGEAVAGNVRSTPHLLNH